MGAGGVGRGRAADAGEQAAAGAVAVTCGEGAENTQSAAGDAAGALAGQAAAGAGAAAAEHARVHAVEGEDGQLGGCAGARDAAAGGVACELGSLGRERAGLGAAAFTGQPGDFRAVGAVEGGRRGKLATGLTAPRAAVALAGVERIALAAEAVSRVAAGGAQPVTALQEGGQTVAQQVAGDFGGVERAAGIAAASGEQDLLGHVLRRSRAETRLDEGRLGTGDGLLERGHTLLRSTGEKVGDDLDGTGEGIDLGIGLVSHFLLLLVQQRSRRL